MKTLLLICSAIFFSLNVNAQKSDSKVDLANFPNALNTSKSNASLLLNAQPSTPRTPPLTEKYKIGDNINMSGTYRNIKDDGLQINTLPSSPTMLNNTVRQINIGSTTATSNTYYDDAGKLRGTSTTIKLGNK